jgi:hypothetical protein
LTSTMDRAVKNSWMRGTGCWIALFANSVQGRWPWSWLLQAATRSSAHRVLHISTSDLYTRLILLHHSCACQKDRSAKVGRQRKNTPVQRTC